MTSLTIAAQPATRPAAGPGRGVTLARTIRSEFTKMTATLGGQRPLMFSAWGELAVFAGYAAILLIAGAVLFSCRDA